MLHVDKPQALGLVIGERRHRDGLRYEPVPLGKHQRSRRVIEVVDAVRIHRNGAHQTIDLVLGQRGRNDVDAHRLLGLPGQHDRVGVRGGATDVGRLGDARQPAALRDDHSGLLVVTHVDGDAFDAQAIEGQVTALDTVSDDAAVAAQVIAHHRDGLVAVAAGDVEGVAAEPAEDDRGDVFAGALDEESVVPFPAVDL